MPGSGDARVLVTGVSGSIGSELVPILVGRGYDVYAWERYVTGRYVLGGLRKVKTVFGDLKDSQSVRSLIRNVEPEVVIHLGAISPVSYSYDHPQEVVETNLGGTINLAEGCMREAPHLRHFLYAGTSEEYGNNGVNIKSEDSPLVPNSPYSVSKVAADHYLRYLHSAYGFPATVLRPFNTYGRRDNCHFVVERTLTQMLEGNSVSLGDPNPVRDFLYIDDHVDAYLKCLENPSKAIGEVINFCTGKGITIQGLVDLIRLYTGFNGEVAWSSIPARPLDIRHLIGDPSKAERILGWEASVTLEEGLKRTVDFWRKKLLLGESLEDVAPREMRTKR